MHHGYVYFIGAHDPNGTIAATKIGFSSRPAKRLAELQTASSRPLTLRGFIPGTKEDEAWLHECFAHRRLTGEWFGSDPELERMVIDARRFDFLPSYAAHADRVQVPA